MNLGKLGQALTAREIFDLIQDELVEVEKHISAVFTKLDLSEEQDVHRRVKAVLVFLSEQRRLGESSA